MSNNEGWKLPDDIDKFITETNQKNFLTDFPPETHWKNISGLQYRQAEDGRHLVSIQGRNQKEEIVNIWTDLPNAMYLLGLLRHLQETTGEPVPADQPQASK